VRNPRIFALLSFALACGEEAPGTGGTATAATDVPQAPGSRVEVATIATTATRLDIRLPGEIAGSRDALLGAPSGGFVERVYVADGAILTQGAPIAAINAAMFSAQRDQAAAQAKMAEAELKRVKQLGDLASEQQLLGAQTQHDVAQASLRLAQLQASRASIRAPFDGVLTQIDLEVGEVVSPGQPVARLVTLDPIHVTVSVADKDISLLKPGMDVMVTADAVPGVFPGKVHSVDLAANLETRTFIAKVEVPNPDRMLLPGMIAGVAMAMEMGSDAIVIPQDWIITRREGVGVFVEQEGVARWRPIRPGALIHDQVVIQEGLAAGDKVVFIGHRALADGDPLIVSRTARCCENGRVAY
jgi:membrane fusion protein (multidrug efflux system)